MNPDKSFGRKRNILSLFLFVWCFHMTFSINIGVELKSNYTVCMLEYCLCNVDKNEQAL